MKNIVFGTIVVLGSIFPLMLKAQQNYAIKNVAVIPMTRDTVLPNRTILIRGQVIDKVDESTKVRIPKDYIVIDGRNKYVIPGLFDMHAHFFNEQGNLANTCETELQMMLANGLTTARIMAGHPNYLEARENVKRGKWTGPDLIVASPQFVGQWPWEENFKNYEIVDTPEMASDAVKKYKLQDYDAIKITFMVDRPSYDAIVSTAKDEGIKVVGHVGPKVKLPAALTAGEQIDHMDEFIDMLLPDSTYNLGQSVSDMNLWRMNAWATVPYLDENKIPELVKMVKESGIYVTPTNFFFISCFGSEFTDEIYKQRPDYDYIPAAIKPERWKIKELNRNMKIPSESLDRYVYLRKKMTKKLWKGGVPLMAGSDSPEWFLVTGFSIHDEIATVSYTHLTLPTIYSV